MRKEIGFLAAICGFVINAAHAQSDTQGWASIAVNGPVAQDSRFLLWFDGHARFRDDISDIATTIIRPGIGYKVSKDLSIWAGYARVTGHFDDLSLIHI